MCNLYSITKGPRAIRDFTRAMRGDVGNMPPLPGVFPDYFAPIVRNAEDGERELVMARWGMPTPFEILKDKNRDPGVTNIRNLTSPHWRRWLGIENRCVVPFSSFSENEALPDGSRRPSGSLSMKPALWLSLPAYGLDGHRCARSKKARRQTTSTAS
jgi:putative SOS response-associated peptidase YedK